jgi:hypothetical protein
MRISLRPAAWLFLLAGCASTPVDDPWIPASPRPTAPEPTPEPAREPAAEESHALSTSGSIFDMPPAPAFSKSKEFSDDKSYWIPAIEILAFEGLLNWYDRSTDPRTYATDEESIEENLNTAWVIDQDPFSTNQLLHPYAGSIYHGLARSAGLNFWESTIYSFAGSALWEVAGENTKPSLNDQIATSFGGSFLGEAFFRISSWILERGGARPGFGREFGAAVVSPPNFVNRRVFGSKFKYIFVSRDAAVATRAELGAKRSRTPAERSADNEWQTDGILQFAVDYGQPGRRDYAYSHPFDYFHLDFAGTTDVDNHVHQLFVEGLLVGDDYSAGSDFDGVWGLYGSYSYLSPGSFRLASTALSVGTTVQDRTATWLTLQGSLLLGFGFGAGGTIADDASERDYHYGATPQGVLDFRCIFGDVVMLQLTGHDYDVGGGGYNQNGGRENILQVDGAMTVRVFGGHALRFQCTGDWRDAQYETADRQRQSVASLSVAYSYLGGTRLAAIR